MNFRSSRQRWFAVTAVALVSIGFGFTGAKILANETIGYLAAYTWFALMLIGVPLVLSLFLIGAILNLFPKTKWFGKVAIMSAVLIVASAFASFKILDAFGKVLYKHEQMVALVPEVAALAIYFKTEASHDQVEGLLGGNAFDQARKGTLAASWHKRHLAAPTSFRS